MNLIGVTSSSGFANASLISFAIAAAMTGCYLVARERKARALVPIKRRKENPVVIRRRRNNRW